jgi:transposase
MGLPMARRTKRLWTAEEKRSICLQTTAAGVSVAQVARRYALNANLVFKWLRDPRLAPDPDASPTEGPLFLPSRSSAALEKMLLRGAIPGTRAARSRSIWLAATGCGSMAATIPRRLPG